MNRSIKNFVAVLASSLAMFVAAAALTGCERKEKILDVETPNGEIEVERSLDTGEVDVEVDEH